MLSARGSAYFDDTGGFNSLPVVGIGVGAMMLGSAYPGIARRVGGFLAGGANQPFIERNLRRIIVSNNLASRTSAVMPHIMGGVRSIGTGILAAGVGQTLGAAAGAFLDLARVRAQTARLFRMRSTAPANERTAYSLRRASSMFRAGTASLGHEASALRGLWNL